MYGQAQAILKLMVLAREANVEGEMAEGARRTDFDWALEVFANFAPARHLHLDFDMSPHLRSKSEVSKSNLSRELCDVQ